MKQIVFASILLMTALAISAEPTFSQDASRPEVRHIVPTVQVSAEPSVDKDFGAERTGLALGISFASASAQEPGKLRVEIVNRSADALDLVATFPDLRKHMEQPCHCYHFRIRDAAGKQIAAIDRIGYPIGVTGMSLFWVRVPSGQALSTSIDLANYLPPLKPGRYFISVSVVAGIFSQDKSRVASVPLESNTLTLQIK